MKKKPNKNAWSSQLRLPKKNKFLQVLALNYPKTLSAAVAAALKSFKISSPKILVIGLGPPVFFGGVDSYILHPRKDNMTGVCKCTLNEDVFPMFENGDVPMSC